MSPTTSTLHVNGVDLHLVEVGEGTTTLLFLHYWGGSSRTWEPVMEQLATTQRCVALDFRGWGRSSKDCEDYSLDTLADDVIEVARQLGLKQYQLVGHSMGGKVAQLVAARQPVGLQGLILYAPAPPNPMAVPEADRRGYIELYQSRGGAERVIGNLTPHTLPPSIREQIIEDTLRGSAGAKEAWPLQGMIADIRHATSRITVPLCIIAGGDDRVEPEASLRQAFGQVLPGVRMAVVPGVGHIAPLEAPAKLANAIRFAQAG